LPGLHLRFLQAEEVCIELGKSLFEVLSHDCPQAVDVPTDVFHTNYLIF
jgi:hypothetical protein